MKQLGTIIEEIKAYQAALGYEYDIMSTEEKLQHLRNCTVALMMEQAELLEEVSWKPWRNHEDQKPNPNMRKVALEWVDCLFFLINQSFCLDLTSDEILQAYEKKLAANLARLDSGYSKIQNFKNVKTSKGENAK